MGQCSPDIRGITHRFERARQLVRAERGADDTGEFAVGTAQHAHHVHSECTKDGSERRAKIQRVDIRVARSNLEVVALTEILADECILVGGYRVTFGIEYQQRTHCRHGVGKSLEPALSLQHAVWLRAPLWQFVANADKRAVDGVDLTFQRIVNHTCLHRQSITFASLDILAHLGHEVADDQRNHQQSAAKQQPLDSVAG